jgi:hypothetical protein
LFCPFFFLSCILNKSLATTAHFNELLHRNGNGAALTLHLMLPRVSALGASNVSNQLRKRMKQPTIFQSTTNLQEVSESASVSVAVVLVEQDLHGGERRRHLSHSQRDVNLVGVQTTRTIAVSSKEGVLHQRQELVQATVLHKVWSKY